MTKEEIEKTLIKRYPKITSAIQKGLSVAHFYVGNRKKVIKITPETVRACELIEIVRESEPDPLMKLMIKLILSDETDVYIMNKLNYSRTAYYEKKRAFVNHVYCVCIAAGIVSFEEVIKRGLA